MPAIEGGADGREAPLAPPLPQSGHARRWNFGSHPDLLNGSNEIATITIRQLIQNNSKLIIRIFTVMMPQTFCIP